MNFPEPLVTQEELYCLLGWVVPGVGNGASAPPTDLPPLPAATAASV